VPDKEFSGTDRSTGASRSGTTTWPEVNVMIANFGGFSPISGEKNGWQIAIV
jgi:hypothetical protein